MTTVPHKAHDTTTARVLCVPFALSETTTCSRIEWSTYRLREMRATELQRHRERVYKPRAGEHAHASVGLIAPPCVDPTAGQRETP